MRSMFSMTFIGTDATKEEISDKIGALWSDAVEKDIKKIVDDIWMDVQDAQKQN